MPLVSVSFHFSQRFPFPAREVYEWATDYEPADIERMGLAGRRRITRLCQDAVLVTDSSRGAGGASVRKERLVRLYPECLFWTNTHMSGPNRYSQFMYQLTPLGENACRLDFTARQIENRDSANRKEIAARAKELKKADAQIWKNLARAMKAERAGRGVR